MVEKNSENKFTIIKPNSEVLHFEDDKKIEYYFYDAELQPVFKTKVIFKNKLLMQVFPFSYSKINGIKPQKISTLEFRGWKGIQDLPTDFRSGGKVRVKAGRSKLLMDFIKRAFPEVNKIVISKTDTTRFSKKTIVFNWTKLQKVLVEINREKENYSIRNKLTINNVLSELTGKLSEKKTSLKAGGLSKYLSLYDSVSLSEQDLKNVFPILEMAPKSKILVTDNFIKTRDKINVAYIAEVIEKFKKLMSANNDNEKEWQSFFADHGWILNHLFAFPVILYKKEAFLGGKTLKNEEGRYVDFLFQNGFKDNYALLEIKTHNTKLLNIKPYREPAAFSMHSDLSGAVSQAIDQKHIFQTDFGQKYPTLDPKVILIVGQKSTLSEEQKNCFELLRNNQKNIEIVTFDEVLQKIETLMSALQPN